MDEQSANQQAVAEACGVAQSTVSAWLNGAVPKVDKLSSLATFLRTTPHALLYEEGAFEGVQEPPAQYVVKDWRKRALDAEAENRSLKKAILDVYLKTTKGDES